ncbi:MAG: altronate hydrolase [Actinomycetota bacterium]|nr:altronate hydrolase [Actinomycetota bacterium]
MTARGPTNLVRLHPGDDVAVAVRDLPDGSGGKVPAGHKVAVRNLAAGDLVRKYGQVIGQATRPIRTGEHVHSHNLASPGEGRARRPAAPGPWVPPPPLPRPAADLPRTFLGIPRADGRFATRNVIAVMGSVSCATSVVRAVAARCASRLPEGVDAVVPLTHPGGCGTASHGRGWEVLRRTLLGYARNPNVGGLLLVGLGCEVNAVHGLLAELDRSQGPPAAGLTIQDSGGSSASVEAGERLVHELARSIGDVVRVPAGVEHLVVGLQCGGSDAWSGVSANPVLGSAVDLLVAAGGTAVLAETPEIFGAEHLLAARSLTPHVAAALLERVEWWRQYTADNGVALEANPSPGNHAGGITTIREKSLGAVSKAGRAPLTAVLDYAEQIPRTGLVFMDTPGYDPVSLTGLVAGGATLICFTTGRGTVLSSRMVPTVKIVSNKATARRLAHDIDLDCSGIVTDGDGVLPWGRRLYDLMLRTATGRRSSGENIGLDGEELVPWQLGAVL